MAFSYRHRKDQESSGPMSGNWKLYGEAVRARGTRISLGIRKTWAWIAAWLHQLLGL